MLAWAQTNHFLFEHLRVREYAKLKSIVLDGSLCVSPETSADLVVRVLCAEMSFPASPDLTSASA